METTNETSAKLHSEQIRASLTSGLLYGTRAAVAVLLLHERLVPDTTLYSNGQAWWSSPITAASGAAGGYSGVASIGILGATLLGLLLGYRCGLRRSLLVFVSPCGWYTMQAGADAVGACGTTLARKARHTMTAIVATSLLHLVAGLTLVFVLVGQHYGPARIPRWGWAIGAGAVACLGETHFQARYFLPGLCYAMVRR
jgi:hypothetical protein